MGDCISSFLATQAKAASSSTADSSIGVAAKNIPVIATPAPKVLVKKKQQEVFFRLPVRKTAGLRLQHAATVVQEILDLEPGLVVFKLGVTMNPLSRWDLYKETDPGEFTRLTVIGETTASEAVGYLEAALIMQFSSIGGCRNIARGGEGIAFGNVGPYFAYIVHRVLPRLPPP